MANVHDVTVLDFKAAKKALEEKEYYNMQIMGNRLISNALLGNDKMLSLVGFFIRDAGIDLVSAQKTEVQEGLAPLAATMLKDLEPISFKPRGPNYKAMWNVYFEYATRAREATKTKLEKPIYTNDVGFTRKAADYLFENFYADPKFLLEQNSRLLMGTFNELERVAKCHSADELDSITICLVQSVMRIQEYIHNCISDTDRPKAIEAGLWPFLKRIREFRAQYAKALSDEGYTKGTELLADILMDWRIYFIRFHEANQATITAQVPQEDLPKDVKDKVDKALLDALKPQG